jgi:hypothetical protein
MMWTRNLVLAVSGIALLPTQVQIAAAGAAAQAIDPAKVGNELAARWLGGEGKDSKIKISADAGAGIDAEKAAADKGDPKAKDADKDAEIALWVVKARAQLGLGKTDAARKEALEVLKSSPDHPGALGVLASIDEMDGRWRQAGKTWQKVYDTSGNKAAGERVEALREANRSNVKVAGFYEGSDADKQYGLRSKVELRSFDRPEIDLTLETRQTDATGRILADGTTTNIKKDAIRGEIAVADAFRVGRLGARLMFAESGVGAGLDFRRARGQGVLEASVAYREPYLVYSEGVANKATSDYVALGIQRAWKHVYAGLQGRYSNYAIDGDDSIARSSRAIAAIDMLLKPSNPNALRFSYVMDGEYFGRIERRTRANLTTYAPMTFVTHEVHSLGAFKTFGRPEQTWLTLGGGYRNDRYGSEGPFGHASSEISLGRTTKLGAMAEYSSSSTRGEGDAAYTVGQIYIRRKF